MSGRDIFYDPVRRDISFVGDELATMSGIQNYLVQLQLLFLTEEGEIADYPDYGTRLYQIIGKAMTPAREEEAKREARRTIQKHPDTERVDSVEISYVNGSEIVVRATGVATGLAFEFEFGAEV